MIRLVMIKEVNKHLISPVGALISDGYSSLSLYDVRYILAKEDKSSLLYSLATEAKREGCEYLLLKELS